MTCKPRPPSFLYYAASINLCAMYCCSLLAIEDSHYTKVHILLSTVAHISLFPLLFKAAGKFKRYMYMLVLDHVAMLLFLLQRP